MPRKSSFLMGFETGQDLYSRGYSQAQQTAQLKLQRDAADQRGKLLDLQMRAASTAQTAKEEQAGIDKDAYAAINSMQESLRNAESPEQRHALFTEMQDQYLPRIMRSREAYGAYGIWRQETIVNDPAHKLLEEQKHLNGMVALEDAHAKQLAAKELRSATRKFTKKFDRPPSTPLEVMNWMGEEAIRELHAGSTVVEPLPADFNFDVNKDGRIDSSDARAYQQILKGKVATQTGRADIAGRELDAFYKEREERTKALLATSAVRVLSHGEILELVKSGQKLGPDSGFGDATQQRVFQMRAKAANKITDHRTSPVDRVALSAVFDDKIAVGEREAMSQAIGVLGQMKNVKDLYARIDTGPFDAKILQVKKWLDSGEGRDAGELRARLQAIIPGLARGIYGEVGVLTDTDIENYMKTFVALDSSQKLNQVLYTSTVDFVEQTIMRKLSNAAGNRLNVSGYQGVMEKIGGVNASPGLWGEAPSGPTSGVRPATEQRPDRPLDVTVNNDMDVRRVALQEGIRTGDFSTQTITMADGTLRRQPMRRDVVIRGAIGYARMLQNRGYDWKTHKTEPPEGTPGPARLSISESLHAEIEAALGEKGEPATQKPAVMGQDELPLDDPNWKPPAPKEPIPPAAHLDASNPDAYKTNKTFQKYFGQLDDAGQRAKWREVYEEYTIGGVLPSQPSAPEGIGEDMGDYPPVPPVIQKPSVSSLGEVPSAPAVKDPLAVDSDDFGGMMEQKEFEKLSWKSSAARKLWEKDKLKSKEWYNDNYPDKDNFVDATAWMQREQALKRVGKTITVRGEKFTVLEAGEKGMLVKDAEGNEYYISNNELPKETAPPVPRDK